jgi:hypothetical protein
MNDLQRVVSMRESIKVVASCAFRVNVLGLNAILLAKKFGDAARGFSVISNELRAFGKELREQMTALNDNSARLVELATFQMRLNRQIHLMQQAVDDQLQQPLLLQALARQSARHAQQQQEIQQTLGQMAIWVANAYQSCLFGTVIARSSRIEAAYAGPEGQVLTTTSNEFADQVEHVLASLDQLKVATGAIL